jgi:UDP-N-acetylmuramoylalanine--D-glutamate ligase
MIQLGFSNVVLHDMRPREELARAFRTTHGAWSRAEQAQILEELIPALEGGRFGGDYLTGIESGAIVSRGQGWYLDTANRAKIETMLPAEVELVCMTELYMALARGPIAAITGTNGKSTTVELADTVLRQAGVSHVTAGNERSSKQLLSTFADPKVGRQVLLLEISNRQLMQVADSPQIAAITALTPDHLDEHGGWDGYRRVKESLFARQLPETDDGSGPVAIAAARDENTVHAALAGPGRVVLCGDQAAIDQVWLANRDSLTGRAVDHVVWESDQLALVQHVEAPERRETILASIDDLNVSGEHNRSNVAVGVAVSLELGVSSGQIAAGIRSFTGKSLRGEQIADFAGIPVISDIKSTTPEATIAALESCAPKRPILLAGGTNKGLSYASLADTIIATGARVGLVPGNASDALETELAARAGADRITHFDRVNDALEWAGTTATDGDAIIISPAAAGFWTAQLQGGPSLRQMVRQMAKRRTDALENLEESCP